MKPTFTLDRLLIALFLLLVSHVVVHSWGVERGKAQADDMSSKALSEMKFQIQKAEDEIARLVSLRGQESAGFMESAATPVSVRAVPAPSAENIQSFTGPITLTATAKTVRQDMSGEIMASSGSMSERTPPVSGSGKKYTVQLITYLSAQQAEHRVEALRNLGYDSFIIPSGSYYQVCVEQLPSRDLARTAKEKIQSQTGLYGDAYIRPLPV